MLLDSRIYSGRPRLNLGFSSTRDFSKHFPSQYCVHLRSCSRSSSPAQGSFDETISRQPVSFQSCRSLLTLSPINSHVVSSKRAVLPRIAGYLFQNSYSSSNRRSSLPTEHFSLEQHLFKNQQSSIFCWTVFETCSFVLGRSSLAVHL